MLGGMKGGLELLDKKNTGTHARSVVFCGLIVALLTISAWVTIPVGTVPVTLQVFVVIFALMVLSSKQFFASLLIYLVLGAVGLPLFSGMRGGLGSIMGPTGGFLWGFLLAAAAALLIRYIFTRRISRETLDRISQEQAALLKVSVSNKRSTFLLNTAEVSVFLIVMYVCGCLQFMLVTGLDPMGAFLIAVAPFIVLDAVKAVCAIGVARAVLRAMPHNTYG